MNERTHRPGSVILRVEFDLESNLESRLKGLAAFFTMLTFYGANGAIGSAQASSEFKSWAGLFTLLCFSTTVTCLYLRSQVEDTLRIDESNVSIVRRWQKGQPKIKQTWKRGDICEIATTESVMASSAVNSSNFRESVAISTITPTVGPVRAYNSKKAEPTFRVVLLTVDGNVLELNCQDQEEAKTLVEKMQKETGAKRRDDLPSGLVVPTRRGGVWTFRPRGVLDSLLNILLAAAIPIALFCYLLSSSWKAY